MHARFGRFRRPAGAHGWNVNESWPGPSGSGIPSTPPSGGLERGSGRSAVRVHGTLLGPEATGPPAPRSRGGGGSACFGLSRAWPRPACVRPPFRVAAAVSGGCDGVVVWELHSGREHLVSGAFGCPCKAISLMEDPVPRRSRRRAWFSRFVECLCLTCLWSSFQGRTVDALALGAEEGRGNLR